MVMNQFLDDNKSIFEKYLNNLAERQPEIGEKHFEFQIDNNNQSEQEKETEKSEIPAKLVERAFIVVGQVAARLEKEFPKGGQRLFWSLFLFLIFLSAKPLLNRKTLALWMRLCEKIHND